MKKNLLIFLGMMLFSFVFTGEVLAVSCNSYSKVTITDTNGNSINNTVNFSTVAGQGKFLCNLYTTNNTSYGYGTCNVTYNNDPNENNPSDTINPCIFNYWSSTNGEHAVFTCFANSQRNCTSSTTCEGAYTNWPGPTTNNYNVVGLNFGTGICAGVNNKVHQGFTLNGVPYPVPTVTPTLTPAPSNTPTLTPAPPSATPTLSPTPTPLGPKLFDVTMEQNGTISVVDVGSDGNVYENHQTPTAAASSWSGWTSIGLPGFNSAQGNYLTELIFGKAYDTTGNFRPVIFGLDNGGTVWYNLPISSTTGFVWQSTWETAGGTGMAASNDGKKEILGIGNNYSNNTTKGFLSVFAIDGNNNVVYKEQADLNYGTANNIINWTSTSPVGVGHPTDGNLTEIAIGQNLVSPTNLGMGTLEVYGPDTVNNISHAYQQQLCPLGTIGSCNWIWDTIQTPLGPTTPPTTGPSNTPAPVCGPINNLSLSGVTNDTIAIGSSFTCTVNFTSLSGAPDNSLSCSLADANGVVPNGDTICANPSWDGRQSVTFNCVLPTTGISYSPTDNYHLVGYFRNNICPTSGQATQSISINNIPTGTPPVSPSATPGISTTPGLSSTPTPSNSPMPTNTPTPNGHTVFALNVFLHGLGRGGDNYGSYSSTGMPGFPTLQHPLRTVTVSVFDPSLDPSNPTALDAMVKTVSGHINFVQATGSFQGEVDVDNDTATSPNLLKSGTYIIKIKVPFYLSKSVTTAITAGGGSATPNQLPSVYLVTGNVSEISATDDVLNVFDYNILVSCYRQLIGNSVAGDSAICPNPSSTIDLFDSGDTSDTGSLPNSGGLLGDLNLFIRELANQPGG